MDMNKHLIAAAALLLSLAVNPPGHAADNIRIGFVTTLSGPAGIIGKHMKDAADLALAMNGGTIGGKPAEIVYADDQFKPDVGRQVTDELLKRDKVDFVTGYIWSNVLLAAYQPAIQSGKILISANAGPHQIAGKECAANFFSASWQNDQTPEAMGKFMQDQNMNDVYLIAPDYAAGHDMTTGFKRYFKNKIAAETYTKFGQSDYQVELSKIRDANPKAVFAFLPGGMGIQFVKQYAQAGLRETIPLYSVFTADETTLPAIGDAADGNYEVSFWASDLDTPRNKEFVAAFRQKYGYYPSYYAAQSFDAIAMIDHAAKAVGGDVTNTQGMIAALEKADFPSVRGAFTYNKNHFPIEDFYLLRIGKDKEGNFVRRIEKKVFDDHADSYADQCNMKR
jgi:branched-chain amino acid transport system substrate-binding protein